MAKTLMNFTLFMSNQAMMSARISLPSARRDGERVKSIVVSTFFTAGIVYGVAGLIVILKNETEQRVLTNC